jgi:hypothetical protein
MTMHNIHDATQLWISGGCPGVAMMPLVGLVASAPEGVRHFDLAPCNADCTGRQALTGASLRGNPCVVRSPEEDTPWLP